MPQGNPKKLVAARLEGGASSFAAVGSTRRTNEYLLCGTVGIAIVIFAVLDIANDTLNVIFSGFAAV